MGKSFAPLVLLLIFLVGGTGCRKQVSLEDSLSKVWTLSIADPQSGESTDIDSTQQLTLNKADYSFTFNLSDFNRAGAGTWTLNDSTIEFTYEASPLKEGVDSTAYIVENDVPKVILYRDGSEVSRIQDGAVSVERKTEKFKISNIDFTKLSLEGEELTLNFVYRPKEQASGFSFIAVSRGLLGILTLLGIAWLFSANRKEINWGLVGKGLLIQLIFAIGVLKVPFVATVFDMVSQFFVVVIGFTQEGTKFLFESFVSGEIESPLINFVVMVLPTIIFFSALTSLLYYLGLLQKIVYGFAWVMKRFMKLSGAESLAAAGNIFLGQTEAPLLVRPYLEKMTKSEIMCLMAGGMATIAGGVLAAYIGFLGGDDPAQQLYFAKHLLAASVMSAPAAVVASKILVPETEQFDQNLNVPRDKVGTNALEAIANGTTDGIKLAVNVAAMLLVFTALMAMGNFILKDMVGEWTGLNGVISGNTRFDGLTFQFIIGYAFAPIAWLMGVASEDIVLVGQLLGEKTILNEFYAYVSLGEMKDQGLFHEQKSLMMATYILCGFANFASIGIQIGGIGALIPTRKGLLSKLGVRALIGGTLACLFTACIVGMIL